MGLTGHLSCPDGLQQSHSHADRMGNNFDHVLYSYGALILNYCAGYRHKTRRFVACYLARKMVLKKT